MSIRRPMYLVVIAAAIAATVIVIQAVASPFGGSPPGRSATTPAETSDDGGLTEGVALHGHWKITVAEPDGEVVSVHDFDNALTDEGKAFLANVLAGTATVSGVWEILLHDCCQFETLDVTRENPGCNSDSTKPKRSCQILKVSGKNDPSQDLSVTGVSVRNFPCGHGTSPKDCFKGSYAPPGWYGYEVTSHTLADPIPVKKGQQIQVEVQLSFS